MSEDQMFFHEKTQHVSKKEKLKQRQADQKKQDEIGKHTLARFRKEHAGAIPAGICVDGDHDVLKVSFLIKDPHELIMLLPKLNELIADNERAFKKQTAFVQSYEDVYRNIAPQ